MTPIKSPAVVGITIKSLMIPQQNDNAEDDENKVITPSIKNSKQKRTTPTTPTIKVFSILNFVIK
jgi:hypothetical protein